MPLKILTTLYPQLKKQLELNQVFPSLMIQSLPRLMTKSLPSLMAQSLPRLMTQFLPMLMCEALPRLVGMVLPKSQTQLILLNEILPLQVTLTQALSTLLL